MNRVNLAHKPSLPVIAAAFAVLALLTSDIKERAHVTQPVAADSPQGQQPDPDHRPPVADIQFRPPSQTARNEFAVVAEITALDALNQAELAAFPGEATKLVGGPARERVSLRSGAKITRVYHLVGSPAYGSGLTLRLTTPEGFTEQHLDWR